MLRRLSSVRFAVSIFSLPPFGIASRALMQRFSKAFSNWFGSTSVVQRSGAVVMVTLDFRTQSIVDEVRHASDKPVYVRCFRIQRLSSGKGQQTVRKRGGSIGGALCRRDIAFDVLITALRYPDLKKFERTRNACQQVVEIVRKAAGKLPHCFHFLGLS